MVARGFHLELKTDGFDVFPGGILTEKQADDLYSLIEETRDRDSADEIHKYIKQQEKKYGKPTSEHGMWEKMELVDAHIAANDDYEHTLKAIKKLGLKVMQGKGKTLEIYGNK